MIQIPQHIALLIEQQLKGQCTAAETDTLQQWRAANTAHDAIYRQVEQIWLATGNVVPERRYDTEKAWEKVDLRLDSGRSNNTVRMMTRIAMAACVAGLLFFGGWFFLNNSTPKQLVAEAGVANKTITLPDGSQVVLRKGATLAYPTAFKGKERAVALTGEAYFDVEHDAAHPFRIQTQRATLEVLGTTFTIRSGNSQDELTVTSGKVLFTDITNESKQQLVLPNQQSVLSDTGISVQAQSNVNYGAWKTGVLTFDNTPINEVAAALSNYYNTTITADSLLVSKGNAPTISATFNQQPLATVLEEIQLLSGIQHRKQAATIILFKP